MYMDDTVDLSYPYLEDDLSKTFGGFNSTKDKKYTIFLCIYKMNYGTSVPFLEFLLQKRTENKKEMYEFAKTDQFQCFHTTDENTDHIQFMNTCLEEILAILNLYEDISPKKLEKMYRGFYEMEDRHVVYAFFDVTLVKNKLNAKLGLSWTILDEIENSGVLGIPIKKSVSDLFSRNNKFVKEILHREKTVEPAILAIPVKDTVKKQHHRLFGKCFLFFLPEKEAAVSIRYAISPASPIYKIKEDVADITATEEHTKNNLMFTEHGKTYLCIRSRNDFTEISKIE